ncbi:MAG: hypothetical protein ACK4P5_00350 [Fimbriimonadales bacterium]
MERKHRAYYELAKGLNRAGQLDEARRMLQEAIDQLPPQREQVALEAVQLGFPDLAEQATMRFSARRLQEREHAYVAVALAYAKAGRDSDAIRVARQINDRILRGIVYGELALTRMRRGEWAAATALIELASSEALPLAQELARWLEREAALMSDLRMQSTAEERLAAIYAQMGDLPKAVHYAARAPDYDAQAGRLIQILRIIVESRALRAGQ